MVDDSMNDQVLEALHRLFQEKGVALVEDPRRLRGLLLDHCSSSRKEVFLLMSYHAPSGRPQG